MAAGEYLQLAATVITSLGVVLGGLTWLVAPRMREWVRDAARVRAQLDPADNSSTASHARAAADAVKEIPALRVEVRAIAAEQARYGEQRIPDRLRLVELEAENHERRLGSVEQALIGQLAAGNPLLLVHRKEEPE